MKHQILDEDFINLDKSNKEDVYVYLTTPGKNKAGQYTRESGFKKNFPKLYSEYLDYFDKDKSGKITLEEVKEVFHKNKEFPEQDFQMIIDQVDNNCDGMIDFNEFKEMMSTILN